MTEVTGTEALSRAQELVEEIDVAMLTTRDENGNLVSRPMSTRRMDGTGDIWFFTDADTKKVEEAESDDEVGLSYCDPKGMRYVSVAGRARIVHDDALMQELYSPSLEVWFEDGLDTPGITLLRVTPVEIEFWEPGQNRLEQAAGMLKAFVTRDAPDDDIVRHAKITC
ncbi:pyridoxamine 5'-phosphate oxidase family protein [Microbacterium sp. bgisy207]|uniref:pyridoxamine 5'-phosphate oxidase family protein n=1 Tax=Microbacterium sp. bgisy207 TaxID=3413800 RepID=UPI003EBA016A